MTYIIAFVIIIVATGALVLFNQPAQAPTELTDVVTPTQTNNMPEGFTPPTEDPPPYTTDETEVEISGEISTGEPATPENPTAPVARYTAEASYFTPKRTEHTIAVTLELDGTTITDATVTYDGGPAVTPAHIGFDGAYKTEVIGQDINNIELSRTGGASLTSAAFNEAVAKIRAQL
jgi:hypothetical protein